jgi:hypothetical protein
MQSAFDTHALFPSGMTWSGLPVSDAVRHGSIDSYDFVCRCIGEQRRAVSIEKMSTMPSRQTSINVGPQVSGIN